MQPSDDNHVGELAELYALGALPELESARVNTHAATCRSCAARIGQAEQAVLGLIDRDVPEAPPSLPPLRLADRRGRAGWPGAWIGAVAAAFVLGLLPWMISTASRPGGPGIGAQAPAQLAMQAMLVGHFAHVPLRATVAHAPAGKVVYALKGGWFFAIVSAGPTALDVVAADASRRTLARASLAAASSARLAFVRVSGRAATVEVVDNGAVVARAQLIYTATPQEAQPGIRTRGP